MDRILSRDLITFGSASWLKRAKKENITHQNMNLLWDMYLKAIAKFKTSSKLSLHVIQFQRLTWPVRKCHAGLRRRLCGKQWHFSSCSSVWHRWPGRKGWVYARRRLAEETKHMEISTSLQKRLHSGDNITPTFKASTKRLWKITYPEVTQF